MPKSVSKMLSNDMLVLLGGLLVVYLLVQYSRGKSAPAPSQVESKTSAPENVGAPAAPAPAPEAPVSSPTPNEPQDLLPQDSNSEWSEFAPQGQGDLLGSGSLLHPQISQRPFNSVQGANALRGDPQISIGDIPSIAAPSNPVQGNATGLN
jgi:hypothetical protein